MTEKCIFLDKDGTLVKDVPYNVNINKLAFYGDVLNALRLLHQSGYTLIIVSNQSGIARGKFTEKELNYYLEHVRYYMAREGVPIAAYYFCPHADDHDCKCRKPHPGMLIDAASNHGIDLSKSWMIGDILADVGAGKAAGCKTILIDRTGKEQRLSKAQDPQFKPDFIMEDFQDVLNVILSI